MSLLPMHPDEFASELRGLMRQREARIGYTDAGIARLGNPAFNMAVRVPNRPGFVYAYHPNDDSREVFELYDPHGFATLDDRSAGDIVHYAYRPGESKETGATPIIYSRGAAPGTEFFQGFAPTQLQGLVDGLVHASKFKWMHIVPNGGFELKLFGGWGRYGNTRVKIKTQIFADVGSYQPTGTNEARYLSCMIDVLTGAKTIVAGDIFTDAGFAATGEVNHDANEDYLPVEVGADDVHLGWAYLHSAMTKLRDPYIHWSPDIFFIPEPGGAVDTFYVLAGTDNVVAGTDNVVAGS